MFSSRFVINLLVTNLLSSVLLIPLLLADKDSSSHPETVQETKSTIPSIANLLIEEEIKNDPTTNIIQIIETGNLIPLTIKNSTNKQFLCYFAQSTTSFVCTACIFSILLIGINQYFGVIHSLRYHFYINRCKSSILIGLSWFLALFCAVSSSLTHSDSGIWQFCSDKTETSESVRMINTVYALGYFIIVILAPFIAICAIYVCIYTAAHQNSERMRRSASAPLNPCLDCIHIPDTKYVKPLNKEILPKVHSAPNFSNLQTDDTDFKDPKENFIKITKVFRSPSDRSTSSFINTLKHKISNASIFRYREETRAAKISILVIFMVLVCYVPYGLTLIFSSEMVRISTSQIFRTLSLVLLVFSNIISPFLFGYRNKRVKREIAKMFGLVRHSKQTCDIIDHPRRASASRNRSFENVHEQFEHDIDVETCIPKNNVIPEVVITCKPENERKSILKRVCHSSSWTNYKKCNFITVPDSCISAEARGSFSSASTQISTED